MGSLVYVRLIGYTAGTLLHLFWMVVILGYRRQRNFERVFFFLCLALFFFYGGSLLALNAQIHYAAPPATLQMIAAGLLYLGLCMLPPLLVHIHLEYAETRGLIPSATQRRLWLAAFYVPLVYFVLSAYPILTSGGGFDFLTPGNSLGRGFGVWLAAGLVFSSFWEARFATAAPEFRQEVFHRLLAGTLGLAALFVIRLNVLISSYELKNPLVTSDGAWLSVLLALVPIVPLGLLIYYVQKFNFLQIGRQRNLIYAVSVTFLALLYLSLVRRVSSWLEPMFPPEASAAILLFVLVVFFEPLQRLLQKTLHETAQSEMDRTQRVIGAVQEVARQGNIEELRKFIEEWLREQLELAQVRLVLVKLENEIVNRGHKREDLPNTFPIQQAGRLLGILQVRPHGAMLSGETRAALEFLCEQLPGALDLCRLIEEKLRLERELAERDRLALVGQMTASISHNLKNPLGSIKTILQVQMENAELPESMRRETKMVLDEISRLSMKLNQLLQFSRPAVRAGSAEMHCDAKAVLEEVTNVLRHEAERRGIVLTTKFPEDAVKAAASAEAVSDIASNLLVNALEAAPQEGQVRVQMMREKGSCVIAVEDNGPGIPDSSKEKILQPFFTTKSQGTGLGLAIVARRVAETSGRLEWESPLKDGRGTRFRVTLRLDEEAIK